jgi:Flp pilus assembly protein TadD
MQLRLTLADLYSSAGKYPEAKALYQELLAADPRSLALQLRLGKALLDHGDPQGALKHFQAALELNPNSPNALHFLTVTLTSLDRKAEALTMCEKLLKLQPSDPIVLNNAAYLLADTGGDLERALTYAQRATRMVPSSTDFSDTLAWVYLKKGLSANAAEIYGQLVQAQPKNPTFRYRYALALRLKGDIERALSEAKTALRYNPTPAQAREIQEFLAQLGSSPSTE